MVDVRKYALSKFIKAEELRDGSVIVDQINAVAEDSKYGRLQIFFSNGRVVSLNEKNVGVLMREFGEDSDDRLWKRIRLSHGTVEYKGESALTWSPPASRSTVSRRRGQSLTARHIRWRPGRSSRNPIPTSTSAAPCALKCSACTIGMWTAPSSSETASARNLFPRRDPAKPDAWLYNIDGVELIPYRLPELVEAIASGRLVVIVEGEACVNAMTVIGVVATTASGGCNWPPEFKEYFRDADVVLLPDADDKGWKHMTDIAASLVASRSVFVSSSCLVLSRRATSLTGLAQVIHAKSSTRLSKVHRTGHLHLQQKNRSLSPMKPRRRR
jgi:hypothetical protein